MNTTLGGIIMEKEQAKLTRQIKVVNKLVIDQTRVYMPIMIIGTITSIVFNWDKIKNA